MECIEHDLIPLDDQTLEQVAGGWGTVARTAIGWATTKLLNGGAQAAAGYLASHAGGGADEGTWTSVGHAHMTA